MTGDHRRILATGIARLRAKIKYRPVVFELLAPEFTLLQLQRSVEALAGRLLHKPNFRRLIELQELVEDTGAMATATGGRPAKLYRFRRGVLAEREVAGTKLPLAGDEPPWRTRDECHVAQASPTRRSREWSDHPRRGGMPMSKKRVWFLLLAGAAFCDGSALRPARAASPFYVIINVDVLPDHAAEGRNALEEEGDLSRRDPGYVSWQLLQRTDRENHLAIVEAWSSGADFDRHVQSEHARSARRTLQPLLASPFDERFFRPLN